MPDNFQYAMRGRVTDQPDASQRGLAVRLGVNVGKVYSFSAAAVPRGSHGPQ